MATRPRRTPKSPDIRLLEDEYRTVAPLAETFAEELAHQLDQRLDSAGVSLSFPIQRRVKEWPSIAEKRGRKRLRLNAIRDLSDLIGLRVILQFRRDVAAVCETIRSHFAVIEEYDTAVRLSADQFGYSSFHFVVGAPDKRLGVPARSTLKRFRAEIQVRTTAQHIWASASHTLQYKHEDSVPPPLRRVIHRVSALLETVDLEFERVLADRETYKSAARELPDSEPLNVDLLEATLTALLPPKNKGADESYAELLRDLQAFDIKTRGQLESLLRKHRDALQRLDTAQVRERRRGILGAVRGHRTRLRAGVFYTHVGLARLSLEREYRARWNKYHRMRSAQPL